jgi:hypothetical protein
VRSRARKRAVDAQTIRPACLTWSGKGRSEVFVEKQVLNQASVWYSYGLVLLVMFAAVAGAAIKDLRLAKAAANPKAE